jgi:hypothetical protein
LVAHLVAFYVDASDVPAAGVNETTIYRQWAAKRLRPSRPEATRPGQPHGGTDVMMRSTRRIGSLFVN